MGTLGLPLRLFRRPSGPHVGSFLGVGLSPVLFGAAMQKVYLFVMSGFHPMWYQRSSELHVYVGNRKRLVGRLLGVPRVPVDNIHFQPGGLQGQISPIWDPPLEPTVFL